MKTYLGALLIAVAALISVGVYAQDTQVPSQSSPVIVVPGTPPEVNPEKPSQPAVSVQEVKSPAAPSHYTDQAIWALMVSFILQYLKKKAWFPLLTDASSARLKAQFGFVTALLTAAGIHFAVTGNILDGGAAITISGISIDALKDIGWQWASQQAWYQLLVKETK